MHRAPGGYAILVLGLGVHMQRGTMPIDTTLELYGDMPLCDFVDEAIKHGLIPLNLQLVPVDELALKPQWTATPTLSAQNGLAA